MVQTFLYNSILLTSLEFKCTARDFLCPWHWLLIDFSVIRNCIQKFVLFYTSACQSTYLSHTHLISDFLVINPSCQCCSHLVVKDFSSSKSYPSPVFPKFSTLAILPYLSFLCFNLGKIVSRARDTPEF